MSAEHTGIRPVSAYILIKTEEGKADQLAARLRASLDRADVHRVNGIYDVVVSLTADATEYVTAAIRDHLRPDPAVKEVESLVWIDESDTLPVPGTEVRPAA
jgi:hypothetical protein